MSGYGGPRKNRTGLIVAIVAVVIVLVIGGGIAALVLTHKSSSSSASSASAPSSATIAPDTSTTPAVVPGYLGVAVPAFNVAYDVPAGWNIESAATTWLLGTLTGRGQADDGAKYCLGSGYRTVSTITDSGLYDLAAAARSVGSAAAQTSYSDSGTPTPATPLTTLGGIVGQLVETDGSWTPSEPGCTTTTYSVYTFAFPSPTGTALVMTILADRGTQGELTPDLAYRIITSVRTVG